MVESVNSRKLHRELKEVGLPVVGVSSSGRVDYFRLLTAAEQETADAVIAAHDLTMPDSDVFIQKLAAVGLSRDDVLHALWKSVAEGDNQSKDILMEILNKV